MAWSSYTGSAVPTVRNEITRLLISSIRVVDLSLCGAAVKVKFLLLRIYLVRRIILLQINANKIFSGYEKEFKVFLKNE